MPYKDTEKTAFTSANTSGASEPRQKCQTRYVQPVQKRIFSSPTRQKIKR